MIFKSAPSSRNKNTAPPKEEQDTFKTLKVFP